MSVVSQGGVKSNKTIAILGPSMFSVGQLQSAPRVVKFDGPNRTDSGT